MEDALWHAEGSGRVYLPNVAVNPAQVGFPAYMSEAQLDEVHAAGWSIVSHTMSEKTSQFMTRPPAHRR